MAPYDNQRKLDLSIPLLLVIKLIILSDIHPAFVILNTANLTTFLAALHNIELFSYISGFTNASTYAAIKAMAILLLRTAASQWHS